MAHLCHAAGCKVAVPPKLFMCKSHWFMVPRTLRNRIWAEYVAGQERRKDPTRAYLDVTAEAVAYVATKEGSS
ncbi:MAG: hypothetical protein JWO67_6498 [Streptosporangiaceae bacterium]|nr:hypothetical protein [Streptosporangiaceae bacterium]